MNAAVAVLAIALALAQDAFPGLDAWHGWPYAMVLAGGSWWLIAAALRTARVAGSLRSAPPALAMWGAAAIALGGLASALLGPDTERIVRAPGAVAPLPDLAGAVYFTLAGPNTIARGDAPITLRRAGGEVSIEPGGRRFAGAAVLFLEQRAAAYVDASNARGEHLTVTQPGGTSFLSPVLLFAQAQTVAGVRHLFDAFALPGAHRSVKALYFSADQTAALPRRPELAGRPAILYAVSDDAGKDRGLAIAASGEAADVAGLRLRATLGTYPQLVVASAPHPLALAIGGALLVAGIAQNWVTLVNRKRSKRTEGTTIV